MLTKTTICIFLLINTVSSNNTYEITDYLSDIIHTTFDVRSVLYYFTNYAELSEAAQQIETAISQTQLPLVRRQFEDLIWHDDRDIFKDGYIVASDNVDYLKSLFSKNNTQQSLHLSTRTRLMIFFTGTLFDFNTEPFIQAYAVDGIDLIIIQGFINYDNVTVKSLINNQYLAYYTTGKDYFIDKTQFSYKWEPNFGLVNKTFHVAVYDCVPFIFNKDPTSRIKEGLDFRIIKEIMRDYPVEIATSNFPAGESRHYSSMRSISRGESDMIVCGLLQRERALSYYDETYPYILVCMTYLVPKPRIITNYLLVFLAFEIEVWLLIALLIILTSIILYRAKKKKTRVSYLRCLEDIVRIYALSPLPKLPPQNLFITRIVVVTWFMQCVLLNTSYSAGYTSVLALPSHSTPIETHWDMIELEITWGDYNTRTPDYFNRSGGTLLMALARLFRLETNESQKNERLTGNKYSVLVQKLPNGYLTNTETLTNWGRTNLKVLDDCSGENDYVVFGMKENSPFTEIFNRGISRLVENGLMQHWIKYIGIMNGMLYHGNFYDGKNAVYEGEHIRGYQLIGACYILLYGFILASVVFIIELYVGICEVRERV